MECTYLKIDNTQIKHYVYKHQTRTHTHTHVEWSVFKHASPATLATQTYSNYSDLILFLCSLKKG